ncbi:MAG: AAA family ATPase [Candidatus Komeilibacteria bacterium]|nr:AAA family ATPase [Candidatus Komeilibacteria bacterium]
MEKSEKVVLGFTGLIASGKGTAAEYLKSKHLASHYRFSTMLRDMAKRIYIPETRDNLVKLSESLRTAFGEDVLAKTIFHAVQQNPAPIIVLPNVRLPQDIKYLKKLSHFILVAINTDAKTRYQRLIKRRQNIDDKTKTWPQFLRDSQLPTETKIRSLAQKASFRLDNNGNRAELCEQIETMLAKINKK